MSHRRRTMKTGKAIINAIWNSRCAETGTRIMKGERMVYDYDTKKCYAIACNTAVAFINGKEQEQESRNTSDMVQAQENAFIDKQVAGFNYHPLF